MGLPGKIKGLLEYKISLDLNAEISQKRAVGLIIAVALLMSLTGFVIGEKIFWGVDSRSVFDRQIEVLQDTAGSENLQGKVDLAVTYYLKGDAAEARKLFKEILQQDKNNAAANIYYGLILADSKNYSQAIPYLTEGISAAPRREKLSFLYLGISYYHVEDMDKALQYLDKSIKINPGSSLAYYYLGLVYKKRNDPGRAGAAFEKALALSGNSYPEAENELHGLSGRSDK